MSTSPFALLAQRHSQPSVEAAVAIKQDSARLRLQVLACIEQHGPITDEEIAVETGISPNTVRPRRVELVNSRQVVELDREGRTAAGRRATRWVVVDRAS